METRNKTLSAAKSGMDRKTASKYLKSGKLPSELKRPRSWKTRENVFKDEWCRIEEMLKEAPELEAKSLMEYLIRKDSSKYKANHLRTLQRMVKKWKSIFGKPKDIIFCQDKKPGVQSQSDFTSMNKLKITIAGKEFEHLLFHFILPYSGWEYAMICHNESFENLCLGYELAVWCLGGVTSEHRTDNLSAATKQYGGKRQFTDNWQKVMDHYGVKPSRNNPGKSHENGSVEQSHRSLKRSIEQQLLLRGHRDFKSREDYKIFLDKIISRRNELKKEIFLQELKYLQILPDHKWYTPLQLKVKVGQFSTVRIQGVTYSVPSRLIGCILTAYVWPDKITLYLSNSEIQTMSKLSKGANINYMHIIDGLLRKPGAFRDYKYRESLYPRTIFRKAYDILDAHSATHGHIHYLELLKLAKLYGEETISEALEILIDERQVPIAKNVKHLIDRPIIQPNVYVYQPNLSEYDELFTGGL